MLPTAADQSPSAVRKRPGSPPDSSAVRKRPGSPPAASPLAAPTPAKQARLDDSLLVTPQTEDRSAVARRRLSQRTRAAVIESEQERMDAADETCEISAHSESRFTCVIHDPVREEDSPHFLRAHLQFQVKCPRGIITSHPRFSSKG